MLLLYTAAVFVGASLLFQVQPLVAKRLLPILGGSPAVWNTCMVFFQAALLAGYGYAHVLVRLRWRRLQVLVHALVLTLPLAVLPLGIVSGAPDPERSPVPWLLVALVLSVGAPFFALSTTGPLLQRWFAAGSHAHARDPYFLYAAGNAGSFGALLSYPFLLEPSLRLADQSRFWSGGYVLFVVLVLGCAAAFLKAPPAGVPDTGRAAGAADRPNRSRRLLWVVLAFVPSSAMLGVTQYLTTDVAAIPLLWIVPLSLYLLTFVLAFSPRARTPMRAWGVVLALSAVAVTASFAIFSRPWAGFLIPFHLLALFAAGMVCHGRLARERPAPEHLTGFYLLLAVGGVLGGAFNALLAPLLFESVLEYPIALVLACLLRPPSSRTAAHPRRAARLDVALPVVLMVAALAARPLLAGIVPRSVPAIWAVQVGLPAAMCLLFLSRPIRFGVGLLAFTAMAWTQGLDRANTLHVERTFFGVHRVQRRLGPPLPTGPARVVRISYHALYHGNTRHGTQAWSKPLDRVATSYYHRTGPIGQVFEAWGDTPRLDRVAVIGLGVGTLAAYGRPGQRFTFYEIDPAVVRIAREPRLFTYLSDSRAQIEVVLGDGRLSLGRVPDGSYGLIVVDAFSSDAIPVHLITREAIALYMRKLRPDGLLALHVTNLYLDLVPVVDAIAADLDLTGLARADEVQELEQRIEGKDASTWAILARGASSLTPLASRMQAVRLPTAAPGAGRGRVWTDSFSDLSSVLRFRRRAAARGRGGASAFRHGPP